MAPALFKDLIILTFQATFPIIMVVEFLLMFGVILNLK